MNFSNKIPAALIGAVATIVITQPIVVAAMPAEEIAKIAKSITVLIDGKNPGSGVIIKRDGNTYTVLTARHVFRDPQAKYEIVAPDEKRYAINYSSVKKLPNVDLAIVEFTSTETYSAAKMGNSDLVTEGTFIYVGGFPKSSAAINRAIYQFTDGQITANISLPLEDGYSLIYSNNTLPGMSGGPILNQDGELVGIHGRADTRIDESGIIAIKTNFNMGIPINGSLTLLASAGVDMRVQVSGASEATEPQPDDDFYIQGENKYDRGDYQGARADFDRSIQLHPNYAITYYKRGRARQKLGDKEGAIADYTAALQINPNLALAYNNRGVARYELEDNGGAIEDYNAALQINPNLALAYNNRGQARMKWGDLGAIEDFNAALRINPQDARSYYNRGSARSDLKDYRGAIEDYSAALRINPNDAGGYISRGIARSDLGDNQGAIEDYTTALRINPNSANAYYNRGLARDYLGDKQSAIQDFQKAADLYKDQKSNNDYQDALNRIRELEKRSDSVLTRTTPIAFSSSLIPGKSSVFSDGSLYEEHTFSASAGQSVTINVTLEGSDFLILDNSVSLFSPDGKLLAKNDFSKSQSNATITATLTATLTASGRYRVIVNMAESDVSRINSDNNGKGRRYTLTIITP